MLTMFFGSLGLFLFVLHCGSAKQTVRESLHSEGTFVQELENLTATVQSLKVENEDLRKAVLDRPRQTLLQEHDGINHCMEEMDSIKSLVKQLVAENRQLKQSEKELKETIQHLQNTVDDIHVNQEYLRTREEENQQRMDGWLGKLEDVVKENEKQKEEAKIMRDEIAMMENMVNDNYMRYQDDKGMLGVAVGNSNALMLDGPAAFSAYNFDYTIFEAGDRIDFKGVEYNSGDYNSTTSEFTCPVDGLYYFNINIYLMLFSDNDYAGGVGLFKQGSGAAENLANLYSYSNDVSIYGTLSSSTVTECAEGETVYVEAERTSRISGDIDARYTTFNGFLLYGTVFI